MTGEVTLTGRVLPVGGVREKILAARRAGIEVVLLPRHNEKDLVDIPAEVKADLTLRLVDTLSDVVEYLFVMPSAGAKKGAVSTLPEKATRRVARGKLSNGRKESPRP
jgi:ATP-dependent Lon protease